MRDDEIRRTLTEANPWWRAAAAGGDPTAWTGEHRLLRDRAAHDLGFRSRVMEDVATGPVSDLLTVLTGPRRIGKSVALLDTAAALCARMDVDPRQVIHLPCDGMRDRDLRRSLTLGRELTRSVDTEGARRRVWLLDEVSTLPGWSAVLKAARDGTAFGDDTVVATGSRWAPDEDVEGNLMAGRAGTTAGRRHRLALPMSFRDFLAATRPDVALPATVHPGALQDPSVADALAQVAFDVDAYDLAWQDYLTCGGFPRAVAEHTRTGAVSDPYLRDLAAWLRRDVDPDASAESVPAILSELAARSSSPLSVTNTASTLGFASRTSFEARLRRLVSAFAALSCERRDDDDRRVVGAQAKLYLTDPVLAWLPSRLRAGLPEPDMTRLTESVIAVALARAIDSLEEGRWTSGDTIAYARTLSGGEIDLAPIRLPTPAGVVTSVPVEAKWVDQGWRAEAKTIDGKYGRGILATKSVLDTTGPVWAVPAPLVALLLA
ncbi:MAG: ATP-binding protein [Actinobacteria bacterium]|nr:ATP-binding protein [Actinomycetota bacterium]